MKYTAILVIMALAAALLLLAGCKQGVVQGNNAPAAAGQDILNVSGVESESTELAADNIDIDSSDIASLDM